MDDPQVEAILGANDLFHWVFITTLRSLLTVITDVFSRSYQKYNRTFVKFAWKHLWWLLKSSTKISPKEQKKHYLQKNCTMSYKMLKHNTLFLQTTCKNLPSVSISWKIFARIIFPQKPWKNRVDVLKIFQEIKLQREFDWRTSRHTPTLSETDFYTMETQVTFYIQMEYPYKAEHQKKNIFLNIFMCIFVRFDMRDIVSSSVCVNGFVQLKTHVKTNNFFKTNTVVLKNW